MIQAGEEPQPLAATPSEWQPSEVRPQSALFIRFLGWWEGRNSWGHCNTHTPEALVSKVRAWLSGLGLDEVGCVGFSASCEHWHRHTGLAGSPSKASRRESGLCEQLRNCSQNGPAHQAPELALAPSLGGAALLALEELEALAQQLQRQSGPGGHMSVVKRKQLLNARSRGAGQGRPGASDLQLPRCSETVLSVRWM